MFKLTLPIALLLSLSLVEAKDNSSAYSNDTAPADDTYEDKPKNDTIYYAKSVEIQDYDYKFHEITNLTTEQVEKQYTNKVGGYECVTLFKQIKDIYTRKVEIDEELKNLTQSYHVTCEPVKGGCCLAGYIHCKNEYDEENYSQCVLPEDCCASHGMTTCESKNHPAGDDTDYAVGKCADYEEVLYCYDWCCEEDEYYCQGDCIKDDYKLDTCEARFNSEEEPFPKTCCCGVDCCEEGEILHCHTKECCVENTVLDMGDDYDGNDVCCCSNSKASCCPNLGNVC